jgi:hypothetical protein
MKKIKIAFISLAIAIGVGGAFATTNVKAPCEYMTNYVLINGSYVLAGTYGLDYICTGSLGVCTWYKPWPTSPWTPCRSGTYITFEDFNKKK